MWSSTYWEYDHRIPLKPHIALVKIKPYKYPDNHKTEIEQMVKQMLQDGLIKLSSSQLSSPVLLVKKKDGNCCFCTDYKAINALMTKNGFPIPTVDELLDELVGAKLFSKLDLHSRYH